MNTPLNFQNSPLELMSSTTTTTPPYEVDECRGVLRVFSDGSVVRTPGPSFPVPVIDNGTVEWKDVQFDPTNDLHLRLYKPRHHSPGPGPKLPIFYYFHGGGFCIGSRTWPNCQNYCLRLASDLGSLVVSPDYRLAPEHRLPAAIDDAVTAIEWLRDRAASDPWIADAADFTSVFISGDSAGGTIAHHLAVKFGSAAGRAGLRPVRVRGYVLLGPFFGGTERSRSEADCPTDAFLNLELNDRFWRLSVPAGADADHPLVNPFGPESPGLEGVEFEPMLIVVGGCDLLRDRAVEYGDRLKGWGKPVEVAEFAGQQHGFFTINPWKGPANELMGVLKRFIDQNGNGGGY